jgi:DNA polymerase-3 subunit epsilon
MDQKGYLRFEVEKTTNPETIPLACFSNKAEARGFLNMIVEKYGLCQKLCGLYPTDGNCFHYEIGACKGACIGRESPENYNKRAQKVVEGYDFGLNNLLIIDAGRDEEEKSVIKIEKGKYIGYGYFAPSFTENNQHVLHECISPFPDNREVQQIIKQYLRSNKVDKIIAY